MNRKPKARCKKINCNEQVKLSNQAYCSKDCAPYGNFKNIERAPTPIYETGKFESKEDDPELKLLQSYGDGRFQVERKSKRHLEGRVSKYAPQGTVGTKELADILDISVATVLRHVMSQEIPFTRVNRRNYYDVDAVKKSLSRLSKK